MFQSQTGSQALSDAEEKRNRQKGRTVSIPNGKPGPLRRRVDLGEGVGESVSIPNGKPGPLRHQLYRREACQSGSFNPKREARPSQTAAPARSRPPARMFQSQTGSQALSDLRAARSRKRGGARFNPKREARPSQTEHQRAWAIQQILFQSQTGSQALSDLLLPSHRKRC